jgi:hypothetical protein
VKEDNSISLIKRMKADMVCSWIIAIIFLGISVYYFFNITKDSNLFVRMSCITVAQILLSVILTSIVRNGRPFIEGNVKRIRTMAIVLLASFPLEMIASMTAGVLKKGNSTGEIKIDFAGLMIMFIGAVIGIISEIFFYGKELEEEMDKIA